MLGVQLDLCPHDLLRTVWGATPPAREPFDDPQPTPVQRILGLQWRDDRLAVSAFVADLDAQLAAVVRDAEGDLAVGVADRVGDELRDNEQDPLEDLIVERLGEAGLDPGARLATAANMTSADHR